MISREDTIRTNEEIHNRLRTGIPNAIAKALLRHKQAGQSIFVWKNGKVEEIPAEEIEVNKDSV
jgi:hypothetical protein